MAKELVQFVACDAPKCNVRREHTTEEPAIGIHLSDGDGFIVGGWGGGPVVETYACSMRHLGPALEARFAEEWSK